MRQTVEFDIALALQLRSQNVSLIVVTISGIDAVTWKVIKVVLPHSYQTLKYFETDIILVLIFFGKRSIICIMKTL
jgi:hypothetical protein